MILYDVYKMNRTTTKENKQKKEKKKKKIDREEIVEKRNKIELGFPIFSQISRSCFSLLRVYSISLTIIPHTVSLSLSLSH